MGVLLQTKAAFVIDNMLFTTLVTRSAPSTADNLDIRTGRTWMTFRTTSQGSRYETSARVYLSRETFYLTFGLEQASRGVQRLRTNCPG